MLLKDQTQRKAANSIFVIPDNVNDLLPDWDYRQEILLTENEIKRKSIRSSKTLTKLVDNSSKIDIKEINVSRSDGLENKYIKVLKCRANFYGKMMSMDE